jgi:hypothetical protein
MHTNYCDKEHKERINALKEALLSMDKSHILGYYKKYANDVIMDEEDESVFWATVHKSRTALVSLPTFERLASVKWLTERGFSHFASDLIGAEKSFQFKNFGNYKQ